MVPDIQPKLTCLSGKCTQLNYGRQLTVIRAGTPVRPPYFLLNKQAKFVKKVVCVRHLQPKKPDIGFGNRQEIILFEFVCTFLIGMKFLD